MVETLDISPFRVMLHYNCYYYHCCCRHHHLCYFTQPQPQPPILLVPWQRW